jgi:hypothetical protein
MVEEEMPRSHLSMWEPEKESDEELEEVGVLLVEAQLDRR